MGILIDTKKISVTESLVMKDKDNNVVGDLRSGVFSPHFGKYIGIAMINKQYWELEKNLTIAINGNNFNSKLTELPFI